MKGTPANATNNEPMYTCPCAVFDSNRGNLTGGHSPTYQGGQYNKIKTKQTARRFRLAPPVPSYLRLRSDKNRPPTMASGDQCPGTTPPAKSPTTGRLEVPMREYSPHPKPTALVLEINRGSQSLFTEFVTEAPNSPKYVITKPLF